MQEREKIGFIGGGNMAEALIKGLINGGLPASEIMVAEPVAARRDFLAAQYGVQVSRENDTVVLASDLLVLAIKPQLVEAVVSAFAPVYNQQKLLVSILAGVATATLERLLGGAARVVRAMPNTPALIGAGAAAICRGRYAADDDLAAARQLFATVGIVQTVNEEQIDAVTGLSGSGPAYVFTVIEALADGGVQQGLSRETALALAAHTVFGAARLLIESGEHPALLRDKVCSPGGTTIAAVKVLEEKGLRAALMEAVAAATKRSRELGAGK